MQPPALIRLVSAGNFPPPAGVPAGVPVVTWLSDGGFPIANVVAYLASGAIPRDVVWTLDGKPQPTHAFPWVVFNRAINFPANFSGSNANAQIAATSSSVFTIKKVSGITTTTVGTVTFTSSSITFATTGGLGFSCAAGDYLTITSPTLDATLSGVMISLFGLS
jgi:hypothetical protein